jgi:hypothetical protein
MSVPESDRKWPQKRFSGQRSNATPESGVDRSWIICGGFPDHSPVIVLIDGRELLMIWSFHVLGALIGFCIQLTFH